MNLLQALSSQISHRTRARGAEYFSAGAVRSLTTEEGVLRATVRGSRDYEVWIEPEGPILKATCTCPYFDDRLEICKHIWAAVLAADAQQVPLLPRGVRASEAALEPSLPDVDVRDGGSDSWSPPFSRRQTPVGASAPRVHEEPAPWRLLLDAVASPDADPAPPRQPLLPGQLLYVIDAEASLRGNALVIELMTRDRKQNGEWSRPRPAHLVAADIEGHQSRTEREILERLVGARPHYELTGGWQSGYTGELSRLQLHGVLVTEMVPRLCALGTCVLRTEVSDAPDDVRLKQGEVRQQGEVRLKPDPTSGPDATYARAHLSAAMKRRWASLKRKPAFAHHPLAWDDGPAWTFTVSIEPTSGSESAGYTVDGWLERGTERMTLGEPALTLSDGIVFTETRAARFEAGSAFTWLVALQHSGRVVVPADARDRLIDTLLAASPNLATVPDDLRVEVADAPPRCRLRLLPVRLRPDRLRAELSFDYDGTIVRPGQADRIVRAPGLTRAIRRDPSAEQRALDILHQHGCRTEWSDDVRRRTPQVAASQVLRLVRPLLEEGWHVEAKGQIFRRPGAAAMAVKSGIDWFELRGHVEYGTARATLPALLEALKAGDGFVVLSDGSTGLLPEEWLRRYAPFAQLGSASGDHLHFKTSQAMLLDAILADMPEASWDDTFARVRKELSEFNGIGPADPPEGFHGALRGYQREGLGWLLFLQRFGFGGCLADDMGLGKTIMVLALLATRQAAIPKGDRRPSLVVAPRSLVFNWQQEAERFTPGLRVLQYVGGSREPMRDAFSDYDVILTTYGTLRRDARELAAIPFDYVVLDEAQAIKNASSVSAKATRVLDARHRLALSGTPIENHLGELWSLFEFLNPGLLGGVTAFSRMSATTQPDDETTRFLARGLRPFMLRRTKEQVASELPPRSEQTLYCEMERPQRALYDELLAHYRGALLGGDTLVEGLGRKKLQVLEALLRLRQAACHPGLVDPRRGGDASAKLDVLLPRLVEAVEEGHKTIVFSQFTSFLAILRNRLDKVGLIYEYLDGRTRDRQSKVERFQQDPACRLFLISLKAGGLGLNLTAAEYVFLLDPWWNPAVEAQAIDRAHRIGQARHVFAYRLIARNTVEERVAELQQRKRTLADAILAADGGLIRDLKREDLELLLS